MTDIPTYGAITYQQVFEEIDVVYERSAGRLKSTYHVAPGADPTRIRWSYPGAATPRLDPEGNVRAPLTGAIVAELIDHAPVAWQERDGRQTPMPSAAHREHGISIFPAGKIAS